MFCFLASGSEICLISLTIVTLQAMAKSGGSEDRETRHYFFYFVYNICISQESLLSLPLPLLLQVYNR